MRTDWCNAAMSTERKPERGEGRGQELERMCGRGGMMQQKSMRCGQRERGGGKIDRIQS